MILDEQPDSDSDGPPASGAYSSSLRIEFDDGTVVVDPPLDALTGSGHAAPPARTTGRSTGVVRQWSDEDGVGVVDADDVPGGCWVHFSAIDVQGYRSLLPGQEVDLEWEAGPQDGFAYRAVRVVPTAP